MREEMFTITLMEALQKRNVTMYALARDTRIPYSALLRMEQKRGEQGSIDLSVLSRICTALDCTPNDLLKHVPDADDELVRVMMAAQKKPKGRPSKKTTKK
jgi:DNA-binding Xre family transcriptional regulator